MYRRRPEIALFVHSKTLFDVVANVGTKTENSSYRHYPTRRKILTRRITTNRMDTRGNNQGNTLTKQLPTISSPMHKIIEANSIKPKHIGWAKYNMTRQKTETRAKRKTVEYRCCP